MFKIDPNPTFKVTVKIPRPGEALPGAVDVMFRHKSVQALADWWAKAREQPVAVALADIVAGIEGLTDDAGAPVSYSDAVLLKLTQQFHAAGPVLLEAYFTELTAGRAKN